MKQWQQDEGGCEKDTKKVVARVLQNMWESGEHESRFLTTVSSFYKPRLHGPSLSITDLEGGRGESKQRNMT